MGLNDETLHECLCSSLTYTKGMNIHRNRSGRMSTLEKARKSIIASNFAILFYGIFGILQVCQPAFYFLVSTFERRNRSRSKHGKRLNVEHSSAKVSLRDESVCRKTPQFAIVIWNINYCFSCQDFFCDVCASAFNTFKNHKLVYSSILFCNNGLVFCFLIFRYLATFYRNSFKI